MAPTLNQRPGMAWAIAGGLYLLLVLWGPTNELHQPAWIVILAAMVAFGVYALRKETLKEFPDAQPGGVHRQRAVDVGPAAWRRVA